jgi:hypothetical protein
MQSHQELLNQARPFCDPSTGEVVQRIPDELMQQLRAAKLAKGIPGGNNHNTQTHATWFVFLTDQIRDRALLGFREANRMQKQGQRGRKAAVGSVEQHPADSVQAVAPQAQRGLAQFRQSRRPAR